jgi:hypothetical protein
VAGSCDHGNEPSGSVKGKGFIDLPSETVNFSTRTLLRGVPRSKASHRY